MDSNGKNTLVKLGGLWAMPSGKGYTGRLGNAKVILLPNRSKANNPKAPDFDLLIAPWEDREKGDGGWPPKDAAGVTNRLPGEDDI